MEVGGGEMIMEKGEEGREGVGGCGGTRPCSDSGEGFGAGRMQAERLKEREWGLRGGAGRGKMYLSKVKRQVAVKVVQCRWVWACTAVRVSI